MPKDTLEKEHVLIWITMPTNAILTTQNSKAMPKDTLEKEHMLIGRP
jgi:hypothetical protein